MIEFVSNCSHKKKWTPKPDFGYDFAEIFIFVRLKMYTFKIKTLAIPYVQIASSKNELVQ